MREDKRRMKRETYHVPVRFYSVHVLQQKLASLVTSKNLTPPLVRNIMEETCVILFDDLKSHSCTDTRSIASESNYSNYHFYMLLLPIV